MNLKFEVGFITILPKYFYSYLYSSTFWYVPEVQDKDDGVAYGSYAISFNETG